MIKKCYVIPIQKKCNSNCIFCISKSRNYDKNIEELKCDEDFETNIELLRKRNIKKFEITGGGEPFLNNDLQRIVTTIKTVIPESHIKLYTNGNILKPIKGIDELDISVVHYNSEINNLYMRSNCKTDLITKLKFFRERDHALKIRLSIPLIKGAIDSPEELDRMIELTKEYVDAYVVRTLYPKTQDIAKHYVDFKYESDIVTMERDNDVTLFDGIIMWSDGNLYSNWELSQKRYLYSYLLLKPDSRTYINEIEEMIQQYGFEIISKQLLKGFIENATLLYREKPLEYLKLVRSHLENTSYLFGNQGLIFILNKDGGIEKLLQDTYDLKQEIRNKYSLTHSKNGFITIGENKSHLNLVHCPDPTPSIFDRDFSLMESMKEIGELDEQQYQLVKKYRSYNI